MNHPKSMFQLSGVHYSDSVLGKHSSCDLMSGEPESNPRSLRLREEFDQLTETEKEVSESLPTVSALNHDGENRNPKARSVRIWGEYLEAFGPMTIDHMRSSSN